MAKETAPSGNREAEIEAPETDASRESFTEWEAGDLFAESIAMLWRTSTRRNIKRTDHDLNPSQSLFHFTEKEYLTAIDLEWTPILTDRSNFRTRGVLLHRRLDDKEATEGFLLEGYLQWRNSLQNLVLNIGKVRLAWGGGYAWNPTQVLIMLPRASEDEEIKAEEGLEMLQVELAGHNITLTAILARLDDKKTDSRTEIPWQTAARLSFNQEPWEFAAVYHQATGYAAKYGISYTGLVTDALELHGEWSRTGTRDRNRILRLTDGTPMGPLYLPARYTYTDDNRKKDYDQILIGGQATFSRNMNIIVELYRTTHGYDTHEWELAGRGIEEALREDAWANPVYPFTTSLGNPYAGFLKNTLSAIDDSQLRQNYLFLRFTSGETETLWEYEHILISNLDDQSQVHRFILHKSWVDFIQTNLEVTLFRGAGRSEFGLNPYREVYALTLDVTF